MSDAPRLVRIETVALVAVGGFVGANLRFLLEGLVGGLGGTLLANVVGSYALGVLLYEARLGGHLSGRGRLVLGTGVLSSFTTYSTFVVGSVQSSPRVAVAYVGVSYALGFAAVVAGRATVVRTVPGASPAELAPEGGDRP